MKEYEVEIEGRFKKFVTIIAEDENKAAELAEEQFLEANTEAGFSYFIDGIITQSSSL